MTERLCGPAMPEAAGPALQPARLDALGRYQRRRRIVLAVLTTAIFAALLFVRSALVDGSDLHEHIEQLGAVLILTAILGRCWCTLYIGGRKSAQIVSEGPYSVTRNPLYLFSAIGAGGIGAMTGSMLIALAFAVLTAVAFHFVIRTEEDHLARAFGEPYRQYMRAVPRFFPNLRLFRESDMLVVRPQLLYRTFADGLLFALAYPFFEAVEYLQNSGILPVVLHVY